MQRKSKKFLSMSLIIAFIFTMLFSTPLTKTTYAAEDDQPIYLNPSASVEERVQDLLSRMTLEEKAAQMLQGEIGAGSGNAKPADFATYTLGSVLSGGGADPSTGNDPQSWYNTVTALVNASVAQTRLKIPVIYGVDAVHGHSNVIGATIFQHNIGLGAIAMGDPEAGKDIVKRIGAATAEEMRVTNIPWTFAPCIANPQNPNWGRTYEGFGEDLSLVSMLGVAYIQGLQGDTIGELKNPNKAIACIKHYLGEGYTASGINQGNVISMTKEQIAAELIKPYADAVAAGARTLMPSYNSIQGVKMHASKYLLTDILKGQLGFTGFVISDYNAIAQITIDENGNPVSGLKNQTKVSINAGNDMLMQPSNWKTIITYIVQLANEEIANPGSGIPMSRIDDAVSRILRVKFEAGLFENPSTPNPAENPEVLAKMGSAEHRALAREAVSKSMVLLKNDAVNGQPILSQLKDMKKIFVAGKTANDIGNQCGGWTIQWQGQSGPITQGTTILEGIQAAVSADQTVTFSADGSGAEGHDVAILVIGERPYAEGNGDRLNFLGLDAIDQAAAAKVKEAGIPTVVVLASGRPMTITNYLNDWAGLVAAWLPGTEGAGVADVLFGNQDFVGKLSMKWASYTEAYPITESNKEYTLFNTGYGLTKNQVTPALPEIPVNPFFTAPSGVEAVALPGKVEAENFAHQIGWDPTSTSFIQNCSDVGGGKNLGSLGAGRYLSYYIDVPQTGTYKVDFRVATSSTRNNAFTLKDVNGGVLCTVSIPSTGGSQSWKTVTAEIQLSAGKQLIAFAPNSSFSFNWMSLSPKFESVNLSVDKTEIERTKTAQLSVIGQLQNGGALELKAPQVKYFSSNPSIASVDSNGVVTGNKVGTAEISATVTLDDVVTTLNKVEVTIDELNMAPVGLNIVTESPIIGIGEEAIVKVKAEGAQNLYGFDMTFNYDKVLFELVGVTADKEFAPKDTDVYLNYEDKDGKVRILATLTGAPQGVTGDVNLLNIKLRARNKLEAGNFVIAKGTILSDMEAAVYTTTKDVVQRTAVADADITGGGISVNDLVLVAKDFGKTDADADYNAKLDMDKDGKIDITDISYVARKVLGQ